MNSLGDMTLEENAAATIDPALRKLIASLEPAGLETHALPPAAMASAATAVVFAKLALAAGDVQSKIELAMAASYAAAFFGLPRNNLLYVIDEVCGTFALTSAQRRDYHARAAALLDNYVLSLKKGSAMSGAYKDGSLGILQNGAHQDGSLGLLQAGAFKDGSLGILQNGAFRDGSLGMSQAGAFRDGSLGVYQAGAFRGGSLGLDPRSAKYQAMARAGMVGFRRSGRMGQQLRGLGGGCGCSGMGADATTVTTVETPFYKKPLVIGGAAVVLGVAIYAFSRK